MKKRFYQQVENAQEKNNNQTQRKKNNFGVKYRIRKNTAESPNG